MRMKAAVYCGPGDIRIQEVERPTAGPDGVVLKVKACGICNIIDLEAWNKYTGGIGLALGHEFVGDVVEIGSRVTAVKVGDRAYGLSFRPCHRCDWCRLGEYWKCNNWMEGMIGRHGAFAEYFWFPFATKDNIVKLPDTLSYHELAFIEPLSLSIGLARKAKAGDVVVVLGQDLLGLGTVAKLKEMGMAKIITSDISKKRRAASKEVGADIVVDPINEDIIKVVMKETSGEGADVVLETDQTALSFLQAASIVKRFGIIWLGNSFNYGKSGVNASGAEIAWAGPGSMARGPEPFMFPPSVASIQVAWGTLGPRAPRWLEVCDLIKSGKITAQKHVSHVFPLDKIKEAFETAMNPHESIKVIVEP